MVRDTRIELVSVAWEATILPLPAESSAFWRARLYGCKAFGRELTLVMRDGRIELPPIAWEAIVLPLN